MANTGLELPWKLWPPSDETRALVTQRIASNLLCFPWTQQRHARISEAEAAEKAKMIEELAFQATQRHANQAADDPNAAQPLKGSSLVGLYAKEASRAALGFLKHGGKGFATNLTDAASAPIYASSALNEVLSDSKEVAAAVEGSRDLAVADVAVSRSRDFVKSVEEKPIEEACNQNDTAGIANGALAELKEVSAAVEGGKQIAAVDITEAGDKALGISKANRALGEGFEQTNAMPVEVFKEVMVWDEPGPVQKETAESDAFEPEQAVIYEQKAVDLEGKGWFFDISTGDRQMLDRATAMELFQPLKGHIGSVSKICLSNKSFGVDAAEVAAECLTAVKHSLLDVDLSDIVAGRPEEEALRAMCIFSAALEGVQLQALNLSENALGEKGVRAFSKLLQSQGSLQKLYFSNNGISEDAAKAIYELLPTGKDLSTLHFHNNMSGDQGAIALSPLIQTATVLEDFRLSSSRLGEPGAIAITKALRSGTNLKKLDLRDNMFGPKGGISLARTLEQHQLLIEVYLSDLGLEDSGARSVLAALKDGAPCLEILDLGGNEITSATAGHIASCIKEKHNLTKLGLAENELKDKGCKIISQVLIEGHDNLRELDVSVNYIHSSGVLALGEAVQNKKDFKVLNVNGNFISKEGLDALRELLEKGSCDEAVLGPLDENEEEDSESKEEDVESSDDHEDEEPDEDTEGSEGKREDNKDLDLSLGSLAVVD